MTPPVTDRDQAAVEERLLVDVGHTRLKFARCRFSSGERWPRFLQSRSVHKGTAIPWKEIAEWFPAPPDIKATVAGTDRLQVDSLLQGWPTDWLPPQCLVDKLSLPIRIDVDFPEKVGIDRLLNGIAANALREPQQPAVNVCSGTAVTVDVISADGVFRGGAILPGILLTSRSLNDYTTTLPLIDPWSLLREEPPVLGKNTEAAIAAGVYWGHLGAVREMIVRYVDMLKRDGPAPLVLITGGAAGILVPYLEQVRHEPNLTLAGLAIASRTLQVDV